MIFNKQFPNGAISERDMFKIDSDVYIDEFETYWITKENAIEIVNKLNNIFRLGYKLNNKFIGKQFHSWTVVSLNADWIGGMKRYNCLCKCGRSSILWESSLTSGSSKSCGKGICRYNYIATIIKPGDIFGKWLVTGEETISKNRRVIKCKCECGREKLVSIYTLFNGTSKSCGCGNV